MSQRSYISHIRQYFNTFILNTSYFKPITCHLLYLFLLQTVEGILKVEYSGGPGYREKYCRCSSVAFNIEVLPSLVFHKWDVMLSER